jgi:hypothetical protein
MFEVRDNPELLPGWQAVADGHDVDWDDLFQGYRSQVDWPGATYWREIAARYPAAKVVLSVRDPDAWFDSVWATIAPFMEARGTHGTAHMNAIAEMATKVVIETMFQGRLSDRDHAISVFNRHIEDVRREIPSDRLLVFNVSEGWGPLCAFLGVAEPDAPFPNTNSTRQFKESTGGNA